MGERWIQECRKYLKQIKEEIAAEAPDRLDLVRTMQGALLALNHSVWGWLQYANNPDIMGKFNQEELNEMSDILSKFAEEFIEYDIKVTKAGMAKGLGETKQRQQRRQPFYV